MPEFPDITIYVERLKARLSGLVVEDIRLKSPFLVRSVSPRLDTAVGRRIDGFRRIGKRVVFELEGDLFLVFHLMIAGRFRLKPPGTALAGRIALLAIDTTAGALILTEAGTKKRASLHVVEGAAALAEHDPGGLELEGASPADFRRALTRRNHTLKRALTDPSILSGIGNAYSDEILHRAKLSPFRQTKDMDDAEFVQLLTVIRDVLKEWVQRLRDEVGDGFPDKVTAFHDDMAVHGRYRQPCPVCGSLVQRIVYATTETNYCATCQTGGKLLADRSLSRLLKKDWPKTMEELELKRRDPS